MCTSSTIQIRKRECDGRYPTLSRSARTSSTPLLLAASISTTSRSLPRVMPSQEAHVPQGSGVGPFAQLSALAKIRAVVVLPVPRGPMKR